MDYQPNTNTLLSLSQELNSVLGRLKSFRQFSASEYVRAKARVLAQFMKEQKRNALVIGISGGIDSAVVAQIVEYTKEQYPNLIAHIHLMTLPVLQGLGDSGQEKTIFFSNMVQEHLKRKVHSCPIDEACEAMIKSVQGSFHSVEDGHNQVGGSEQEGDNEKELWARGQAVSYLRTPHLYYATSALSAAGFAPMVVGTTNASEGSFIGYVGKSADGMVDVQLISDIYKSEVVQVAKFLNIPEQLIKRPPSPDMFDGRMDEQLFGFSYDALELALLFMKQNEWTKKEILLELSEHARVEMQRVLESVGGLHRYNKHKYNCGSPAVHLDLYDASVEGGWIKGVHCGIKKLKPQSVVNTDNFIGFVQDGPVLDSLSYSLTKGKENLIGSGELSKHIVSGQTVSSCAVMSSVECERVIDWFEQSSWLEQEVYQGEVLLKGMKKVKQECDNWGLSKKSGLFSGVVTNERLSFYCKNFAKEIEQRLMANGALKNYYQFDEKQVTGFRDEGGRVWGFESINPMFRVIKYVNSCDINAHYDDSLKINGLTSSHTLLIYLNDCGQTVFYDVLAGCGEKGVIDTSDEAARGDYERAKECYTWSGKKGAGLLFPHHLLHSGRASAESVGAKYVIRSEIMLYQVRVGEGEGNE